MAETPEQSRQRRIRRMRRQERGTPALRDVSRRPVQRQGRRVLPHFDIQLLAVLGLMLALGSLMVFSATWDWSNDTYGTATGFFLNEHIRNVLLAIAAFFLMSLFDYRRWKPWAPMALFVTFAALIAVLAFGEEVFGARRSFSAGSIQPSEVAEFSIVFFMASWLSACSSRARSLVRGLLPFLVIVSSISALIFLQPDLSSSAIVALTAGVIFFVAGASLLHLGMAVFLSGLGFFAAIQFWGYASARVANYLVGLQDITLSDYHTLQAITAFVRGGWTGVGVGQSEQKFGALPAPHTDSIFAVIGEELGLLGALLLIALYIYFAYRGFRTARMAHDSFGALLCVGFTSWVIIQALLNIAVMTGLFPSTGVPLPLISYGGSSLVAVMAGAGMITSVHRIASMSASAPERREDLAHIDRRWRDGRARVSGSSHRAGAAAQ